MSFEGSQIGNEIMNLDSSSVPSVTTCTYDSSRRPDPPPGRPTVRDLISQLEFHMSRPKTGYVPKKGIKMALFVEYEKKRRYSGSHRVGVGRRLFRCAFLWRKGPNEFKSAHPYVKDVVVRLMDENEC